MTTITMTSKGQVTLPADVRTRLRIGKGTRLTVVETVDGSVLLTPRTGDIRNAKGIVKYDGPPVSVADMDAGIADAVAERYRGSL